MIVTKTFAQVDHSYFLVGLESKQIPVSVKKATTLLLPAPIRRGTFVSRDIAVQKVKGIENSLEIKAIKENFITTNLNVYCVDGKIYSFDLIYNDSPSIVNYAIVNAPMGSTLDISKTPAPIVPVQLNGLPVDEMTLNDHADSLAQLKGFLHKRVNAGGMHLKLKGIYLKDSLLWISINITNTTAVPFRPDYLRLYVVDKKKAKRKAIQQVAIIPVFSKLPPSIEGHTSFSSGYPLFTISKNKRLLLEMAELDGGRLLQIYISNKTLLRARIK
jgi:conjugative transposon TraN protein